MAAIRGKYYVDEDKLFYEIVLSKGRGILSDEAIEMFFLIVKNVMRRKKYYNPIDREDCSQSAIEIILKNWKNFDERKYKKALPYITELTKRAMAKSLMELHDTRMINNLDYVDGTYHKSI